MSADLAWVMEKCSSVLTDSCCMSPSEGIVSDLGHGEVQPDNPVRRLFRPQVPESILQRHECLVVAVQLLSTWCEDMSTPLW